MNLLKLILLQRFSGNPLIHVAHKADILRLYVLLENGVIYMYIDTIWNNPSSPLLNNKFGHITGKSFELFENQLDL
ncbi:MAG: hypothetical protein IPP52_13145 [Ignavibacteria bacterium]|nr:hypothetical protein [Ignavibacteria bacterium]